ncbi:MAG: DegV family protein with EDD domain [Glaciecola sp.]|jgi:DegV family protein with EDD domain
MDLMAGIAVVTDSTADLPAELAEERGLRVVPMSVAFGRETFVSRITITDQEFYERLAQSTVLPTTSQPAPRWFEEAYLDAADEGCEGIVSVHLSGKLSGTVQQARRLGEMAQLPVTVVETGHVGGGLALAVLAANRRAVAGGTIDEVAETAILTAAGARSWILVDTLDYLKRGGRLTGAQALMGSVLRVKPILSVMDGVVEVVERCRTSARGIETLARQVAEHVGDAPAHVIVSHAMAPERAEALWYSLEAAGVKVQAALETKVGPVLGTHAGPGTVAVSAVLTP